ncbi:MAG: restriction endonuclease [Nevskiaceae bacterium]|nr:MAG: restriction endonuclease [Nevskiaceae bacterium]TAM22612.1 MAG: restriction endonuclease [Nevskiaceae bacterium]
MPAPTAALTIEGLVAEAARFSAAESAHDEPSLFGVTDGKAVGTYLEHKFVAYLMDRYSFAGGNSASGIDIPVLNVDIKVTSVKQPQSSCPFKSARQKIFGLGYHLIVFVYEKSDDSAAKTARLTIQHNVFIDKRRTADYQMTRGLREIIQRDGNAEDLVAFMHDRNLPVDDIEASAIAELLLREMPEEGYLTISNALQWRLQYGRVIQHAGIVDGITRIV